MKKNSTIRRNKLNNHDNQDKSTFLPKLSTISWEDPQIEIDQLAILTECYFSHPTALLIGSSTDTALALYPHLDHLTVASDVSFDLAIFMLKKAILAVIELPFDRSQFLAGTMKLKKMIILYRQIENEMGVQVKLFWRRKSRLSIIFRGINNFDHLMNLFNQFRKCDNRKYSSSPDFKFRKIFSHRNLKSIISDDQFQNSLQKPFYKYFNQVYNQLLNDIHSPYTYMVIKNEYELHNYPPYLNQEDIHFYKQFDHLDLVDQNVIDYLNQTSNTFSLISLSNLTDNLDLADFDYFFRFLKKKVQVNGRIILRRRNTDYPLYNHVNEYFIILNCHQKNETDRTHLYREIIIATPRK